MALDATEIRKTIQDELNASGVIPSGHKGAFVVYYDGKEARTAIAFKTGNNWQITSEVAYHPYGNGLEFGVNVMKTW